MIRWELRLTHCELFVQVMWGYCTVLCSQIQLRHLCIQYSRTSLNKILDKHLFLSYLHNASDISVNFSRALVKVAWVVNRTWKGWKMLLCLVLKCLIFLNPNNFLITYDNSVMSCNKCWTETVCVTQRQERERERERENVCALYAVPLSGKLFLVMLFLQWRRTGVFWLEDILFRSRQYAVHSNIAIL